MTNFSRRIASKSKIGTTQVKKYSFCWKKMKKRKKVKILLQKGKVQARRAMPTIDRHSPKNGSRRYWKMLSPKLKRRERGL